jgi:hypothetical protein
VSHINYSSDIYTSITKDYLLPMVCKVGILLFYLGVDEIHVHILSVQLIMTRDMLFGWLAELIPFR